MTKVIVDVTMLVNLYGTCMNALYKLHIHSCTSLSLALSMECANRSNRAECHKINFHQTNSHENNLRIIKSTPNLPFKFCMFKKINTFHELNTKKNMFLK